MEVELKKEHVILGVFIALAIMFVFFASRTQILGEDEWVYLELGKNFANFKYPAYNLDGAQVGYPPLIGVFYAIPFAIFGQSLAAAKVVVALFGVGTLYLLYLLCKKLDNSYVGTVMGLAAGLLLITIPIFDNMSMLAYVDVPIAFFSALFLYWFYRVDSTKSAIILGIIGGLGFLMKISMLILPASLFLYALYQYKQNKDKTALKYYLIAIGVFALIAAMFIGRNLLLYNYPYVEGLNMFFKLPTNIPQWVQAAGKTLSLNVDIISTLSLIPIAFFVFGITYMFLVKDKTLLFPILIVAIFFILYMGKQLIEGFGDQRYFLVMFPEIVLIGGYYMGKLYQENKYYLVLVIFIGMFALYTSYGILYQTANSQRYPTDYVQALTWINQNTLPSEKVFTAYSGSVHYFAQRNTVWAMNEFPELMTTADGARIYQVLKAYNVSYVLIWRGVVASTYIVPQSNLIGAFTPNFINNLIADNSSFTPVFQNTDNIIFKVK